MAAGNIGSIKVTSIRTIGHVSESEGVMKTIASIIAVLLAVGAMLSGCRTWDNFTTYFNTYYNMNRLMIEVEDEFGYLREQEATEQQPRVFFVERSTLAPELLHPESKRRQFSIPPFMLDEIIPAHFLASTRPKLDSIILKGSKILAKHPQSDYIDGTLYLMAKAYFYKGEWINCEVKCLEFIENFPRSPYSPDVHLLLAKTYLLQRKFQSARKYLDRTVDIAWAQDRYDILSQVFRLQASLALYEGKIEEGLRPYRRAIAQAEDSELKARWQLELAALLYRMGKFDYALPEFRRIFQYDPTDLVTFEAQLYTATTLAHLHQFRRAADLLRTLRDEDDYARWEDYILAQELQLARLRGIPADSLQQLEQEADAQYPQRVPIAVYFYDRAMDLFEAGDLRAAREYFGKAALRKSPLFFQASTYFSLLTTWQKKLQFVRPLLSKVQKPDAQDSLKATVARSLFALARTHQKLGLTDSAIFYYQLTADVAPRRHTLRAKALYALGVFLQSLNRFSQADSLFEQIAREFPKTEYANAAKLQLGYTPEALIDAARELYESAYHLLHAREYDFAFAQLRRLLQQFPQSPYTPQALYLLGWYFERYRQQLDSAFWYYYRLIQQYPNTEYAREVYPAVAAYIDHHYAPSDSTRPKLPKLAADTRKKLTDPSRDFHLPRRGPKSQPLPLSPPAEIPIDQVRRKKP